MSAFLHWLKSMLFGQPTTPEPLGSVVVQGEAEPWTDSDRAALAAFLASETGRCLWRNIQFYEQAYNRQVILDPASSEYRRGRAAGYHAFGSWLQLLSISGSLPPHPEASSDIRTGVPDVAELYAP